MSYLHCHNCHWSQDDFWSDSYNPITFMEKGYTESLLNKPLDEWVRFDKNCFEGFDGSLTRREYIAKEMEIHANRIRKMVYRTFNEYKILNPERKCPNCGEKKLDID